MSTYLIRASYTTQGIQGVLKDGAASREQAARELVESVGGRLIGAWWALGDDDFVGVAELPDNGAANAIAATTGATGAVNVRTTVLLTAAEVDAGLARRPTYRAPGA